MADQVPTRWKTTVGWNLVDEVEFITQVAMGTGSWELDTVGPVEVAFDQSGWLLWRAEGALTIGGAFPMDKVTHVTFIVI